LIVAAFQGISAKKEVNKKDQNKTVRGKPFTQEEQKKGRTRLFCQVSLFFFSNNTRSSIQKMDRKPLLLSKKTFLPQLRSG